MPKGTLTYKLYQQKSTREPNAEPKWYARASRSKKEFSFDDLIEHMSEHNSIYTEGVIGGVLKDMLKCVKELLLNGYSVRLGDLGLFSIALKSKGSLTIDDWKVSTHLKGVKLLVRNTKKWSNTELRNKCSIIEQDEYSLKKEDSSETSSPDSEATSSEE